MENLTDHFLKIVCLAKNWEEGDPFEDRGSHNKTPSVKRAQV